MNPVLPVKGATSPAGPATSGCAAAAQSNTANNVSVHNFVCFMLDRHFTRNRGDIQGGVTRSSPPPGSSPLSPLLSPSHRPGEGDLAGAIVPVGCFFYTITDSMAPLTRKRRVWGSYRAAKKEKKMRGGRGPPPRGG